MDGNKYSSMQKEFYDSTAHIMKIENHKQHDSNPDYWDILLASPRNFPEEWDGALALDFGCGAGRNIYNMSTLANWARVDGVDISSKNIENTRQYLESVGITSSKLYVNNGYDLQDIKENTYDFVMSTIVFQHIAVHGIRFNLMKEIYRILRPQGLFSFQMAYGNGGAATYYENRWDASGTNGACDATVSDVKELKDDLTEIGYHIADYAIRECKPYDGHDAWIFMAAQK